MKRRLCRRKPGGAPFSVIVENVRVRVIGQNVLIKIAEFLMLSGLQRFYISFSRVILNVVHAGIDAAQGDEIVVLSGFNDPAFFDDENKVRLSDGGEAVRHD